VGHYGESIVAAAEEAGIDLGAWDKAVKAGQDTAEQRQKLAEQTGIPTQLIEQYEAAFRPKANDPKLPDRSSRPQRYGRVRTEGAGGRRAGVHQAQPVGRGQHGR
jgi:hypothetical protein